MRIRVTVDRFLNTLILVFTYKEVVFCLACCTVCNNLTLFSLLSFTTIWHSPPPHIFFCPLVAFPFLFCATATRWRIAPILFCLFLRFLDFPPSLLCAVSFSSSSLCLSQCDGLSGWLLRCSWPLCKYIHISTLLPHSCFPPVACGFSSVKWQRTNPKRCLRFKCWHFPHLGICSLPLYVDFYSFLREPNCNGPNGPSWNPKLSRVCFCAFVS